MQCRITLFSAVASTYSGADYGLALCWALSGQKRLRVCRVACVDVVLDLNAFTTVAPEAL